MSLFKIVCILAISASLASALATPHVARRDAHHALAARVASTGPLVNIDLPVVIPLKRSINRRCKTRSSTSKAASSTTVVGNIGADPTTSKVTTTTEASPTHNDATKTTTTKSTPTSKSSTDGSNLPSYMTGTQSGEGTYYGTGLGACGITNSDTDYIAAVSHLLFDTYPGYKVGNPNNNPLCGRKVTATYQGKSVTVAITDRCVGCRITDLDFSPTAFKQIADQALGRLYGVKWTWA